MSNTVQTILLPSYLLILTFLLCHCWASRTYYNQRYNYLNFFEKLKEIVGRILRANNFDHSHIRTITFSLSHRRSSKTDYNRHYSFLRFVKSCKKRYIAFCGKAPLPYTMRQPFCILYFNIWFWGSFWPWIRCRFPFFAITSGFWVICVWKFDIFLEAYVWNMKVHGKRNLQLQPSI